MQFCFAGSPRGEGRGRITEVRRPDPNGWCGLSGQREAAREDARSRLHARPSIVPSTTTVMAQVSHEKGKGESPKPAAPGGEALRPWVARVSLKGTGAGMGARPQAKPPHACPRAGGGLRRVAAVPLHPRDRQHAQGSSKAVSSKPRPLCAPRDRQPPAGGRGRPLTWPPTQFSVGRASGREASRDR